jgi:hypothetical protein
MCAVYVQEQVYRRIIYVYGIEIAGAANEMRVRMEQEVITSEVRAPSSAPLD